MKNNIYLFIFFLALISCEKKFMNGHVTVYAHDILTGVGLDSVHVSVSKIPNGDLGNSKTVAGGYTDINGNLEFNFSRYKFSKSWFIGHSFDNENYVEIDVVESGKYYKDINLDIQYAPAAWLDLSFTNQNCFSSNDSLYITEINILTGDSSYNSNWNSATLSFQEVLTTGCFEWSVDNTTYFKTNAGNRRYYGYIKRDNGTTYFDTTIFIQPWQNNFVELNF